MDIISLQELFVQFHLDCNLLQKIQVLFNNNREVHCNLTLKVQGYKFARSNNPDLFWQSRVAMVAITSREWSHMAVGALFHMRHYCPRLWSLMSALHLRICPKQISTSTWQDHGIICDILQRLYCLSNQKASHPRCLGFTELVRIPTLFTVRFCLIFLYSLHSLL